MVEEIGKIMFQKVTYPVTAEKTMCPTRVQVTTAKYEQRRSTLCSLENQSKQPECGAVMVERRK